MSESTQNMSNNGAHVRHTASFVRVRPSRISNGGGRNSSIELLRIIATYLIILRHFVVFNTLDVWSQPLSVNKLALEGILYPSGKVGVVLFFLISAWSLCESSTDIKASFKRVWILEREILFYSFALLALFYCIDCKQITKSLLVKTVFPISTNLWWYVTSYAIFLVLMPFVSKGLRALGEKVHKTCCIVCIIMWSVCGGLVNFVSFDMVEQNVLIFLYLYTLVSYWRWYIKKPIQTKIKILAILAGYAVTVLSVAILSVITTKLRIDPTNQGMLGKNEWMLPVMLISFGTFALFKDHHFVNRIINNIAKSMLAVYLITVYPLSSTFLWGKLFDMTNFYETPLPIPFALASGLLILAACLCFDYLRRCIFRITIDRNKGKWFDLLWNRINANSR